MKKITIFGALMAVAIGAYMQKTYDNNRLKSCVINQRIADSRNKSYYLVECDPEISITLKKGQ